MIGILCATAITAIVVRMILKDYKPQAVLLFGGISLMFLTIALNIGTILPPEKSTGFVLFDIFEFIKLTFSNRAAGLGLIVMAVAGFAKYMDHIGASKALVFMTIKPLNKINSPYAVLALGYVIGQFLNIFVPSASGLGVLLMVTLFPILVSLGVSRLSAVAVIGTTACLDLGPASGNAILAEKNSGARDCCLLC